MSKTSLFGKTKDFIAEHYGNEPGRMLIHTGVVSWLLSSAAQIVAIAVNDKIPKEQKMFLVPQEAADAGVNIASFYLITQTCASLSKQLVKTGKWLPKTIAQHLKNINFDKIGKLGTDISKDGNLTPELKVQYDKFNSGMDVIATTIGSVISCNIVTPILRNKIAANRQKQLIDKYCDKEPEKPIENNTQKQNYFKRPSIYEFPTRNYSNYLKI